MVGVDDRGLSGPLGLGHARLTQHSVYGGVMDPQLSGDRVHTPALHEVIAKDLRIEFLVVGHTLSPAMACHLCRFTLSGVVARVPMVEESGF
jgi:hypothetical protein